MQFPTINNFIGSKFRLYTKIDPTYFENNAAATTKAKDSVSRNLIEWFKEVQDKESRDHLSDVNHCNDYESDQADDEQAVVTSGRVTNYERFDRNTNCLSPAAIYVDNDPANTSDCTSFPHYIVSPTPEKQANTFENTKNDDYERWYRQDNLADIK